MGRVMGMVDEKATVLANERLTDALWLMTLEAPGVARGIGPGQFVHMSLPTLQAHILRRPFSVYDRDADAGTIDVLYQVVGTGTADMTGWVPGQEASVLGPIGSRWSPGDGVRRALVVGGGVGAAPLYMLTQELVGQGADVDVILGAATGEALVCRQRYSGLCDDRLRCSTDDGSLGTAGFATVPLAELLEEGVAYDYAAVCGPEPLMRAASRMTLAAGIRTQVSLERRMACGIGACLSCTCDTTDGRKRVCVDGPIFEADEVEWS